MMRLSTWFKCAGVLLAVSAFLWLPQRCEAQGSDKMLKVLNKGINSKLLSEASPVPSLKEVLSFIAENLEKLHGPDAKLPIQIDAEAFKRENPDAPDIYDTRVQFPPFPESMTVARALRIALDKVDTKNATYVVLPDHILVTTYDCASAEAKLNERVRGVFKGQVAGVLRELSETLGTTIVVDSRVGEKAKTELSVTFLNDIPLAGALRTLTEIADLKVVVLDGAIFVTTPAHAEALRKEQRAKTPATPESPTPAPGISGPGLGGFPQPPGPAMGGFGGPFHYFLPTPVDPLWPYVPRIGPMKEPAK